LVLFDEIGAGTDPQEGAALAKAILTKLIEREIVVAASTHYGELKDYALHDERFTCAAMEFDLQSLRPTYRLIMGASGASHAFEISKRHGLPSEVVRLAEDSLGEEAKEERSKAKALDALVAQTRQEREEAERIRREMETQYRSLEKEKTRRSRRWQSSESKARRRLKMLLGRLARNIENYWRR
jgi:DNA mismatch repair protein MutS2